MVRKATELGMLKEIGKGAISMYVANADYSDPDH
jgi:hypothetical protein